MPIYLGSEALKIISGNSVSFEVFKNILAKLDEYEATISSQLETISSLNTTVAERDATISSLEATNSSQESTISSLNTTIAECDETISSLEATIVELESKSAVIEISTAEEMDAVLTVDNHGNIYRYVGETDDVYTNGALYEVGVVV